MSDSSAKPYFLLGLMTVVMFMAMYALMYAMVDRWANVFSNVNQFYMAGLMTAPMVMIELAIMQHMYSSRRVNMAIVAGSIVALAIFWFGIREQWAVGDGQFLRSMIPHHAGAILMCEEAPLERAEIKALCGNIIRSQQEEIAQMKQLLGQTPLSGLHAFGQ